MIRKKNDPEADVKPDGVEQGAALPADEPAGEEAGAHGKRVTIKHLQEELKAREEEIKSLNDRLLRVLAEFENYKKRSTKEKSELLQYATDEMSREMLRTVDTLELAIKHARETSQAEGIIEGIEMTLKQLLKSLERFGVSGFNSQGEKFDPNRHEAMLQVESADNEPNTIIDEAQKGYFLRDRLLRPAQVTVTKEPQGVSEE
jgi:molecular chaperone GrpE